MRPETRSQIRELVEEGGSDEYIAFTLIAGFTDDEREAALHAGMVALVWKERRQMARSVESVERHRLARHERKGRSDDLESILSNLSETMEPIRVAMGFTSAFLATEFAFGDGQRVTWGEATEEDHRHRVTYIEAKISSMADDVDLHRRVADILEMTGALNLHELRRSAGVANVEVDEMIA